MKNENPTLYIFSGLPATGKTTLARLLASQTGSVFLRIDTIEQGLRDLCSFHVEGEGYRLSYRIARDNLLIGCDVIADSCNPIRLTRREWEEVATSSAAKFENIQVICSDEATHVNRVEERDCTIPGLKLPSWTDIMNREYHEWDEPHHVIDTACRSVDEAFSELLLKLKLAPLAANKANLTDTKSRAAD